MFSSAPHIHSRTPFTQGAPTAPQDASIPLLPVNVTPSHSRQNSQEALHPHILSPGRRPVSPVNVPLSNVRSSSQAGEYPPSDREFDAYASFSDYQDPFTARSQASSSLAKSSSYLPLSGYEDEKAYSGVPMRPSRNPFSQRFEAPNWLWVGVHVMICLLAYPVLLGFVLLARNRTLFWTRLLVSCGCGLVGFWLGWSLINLGKAFVEAAAWATLIHQSRSPSDGGMKLADFSVRSQESGSAWTAFLLLWSRSRYNGTLRAKRKQYDSRFWSFYILFFLFLLGLAATLPFILGRIVAITTSVQNQHSQYNEILVKGALSETDIENAKALRSTFNDFTLTWTLSPFSTNGGLPPTVSFPWEDDRVYFSETARRQLLPDSDPRARGFGTFEVNTTTVSDPFSGNETNAVVPDDGQSAVKTGASIRYPRWGIRIHCSTIPDPTRNIIPRSANNNSYILMPRDTIRDLFTSFGMDMPAKLEPPLNTTKFLDANDTLPGTPDFNSFSLAARFLDNGVAHSLRSFPVSMGEEGTGFVTVEAVLVRLNTSYTPNGQFPVVDTVQVNGRESRIGYDGAVCLEVYEPWVVETYNATSGFGAPSSVRIVGKGAIAEDLFSGEQRMGDTVDLRKAGAVDRLDSRNMTEVYIVAHTNSVNQIIKDNGRDAPYVPSPTVISFTNGLGPQGYTALSASIFGKARALADATNVLPYFSGTGSLLARNYPNRIIADASFEPLWLGLVIGIVGALGVIAGVCVPRLPMGANRRGFGLVSWVAALWGDEVRCESETVNESELRRESGVGKVGAGLRRRGMDVRRNMEISEIEERFGGMKLKYVF